MITDTRVRSLTKDEVLDREISLGKRNATSTKPYRWVVVLAPGQAVKSLDKTGSRNYGPATLKYTMYSDGGIDVIVEVGK